METFEGVYNELLESCSRQLAADYDQNTDFNRYLRLVKRLVGTTITKSQLKTVYSDRLIPAWNCNLDYELPILHIMKTPCKHAKSGISRVHCFAILKDGTLSYTQHRYHRCPYKKGIANDQVDLCF